MARFGVFDYGTGILYGASPTSGLSVQPFTAIAIDYAQINVSWISPDNIIAPWTRFRLVRSYLGVPETQEDGVILLDYNATQYATYDSLSAGNPLFKDGVDNVLVDGQALASGGYVYYSIWLYLSDGWYLAGATDTILAGQHATRLNDIDLSSDTRSRNTHQKIMDLLPRVFTSATQDAIDEVGTDTDLYNFLYSFSYTVDEALTFIDILLPDFSAAKLPAALLALKAYDLGLSGNSLASIASQKRLVREAQYIYSSKGTPTSLKTLVESMTGVGSTVTPTYNLMLTNQDSTFNGSVGFWTAGAGATISAYQAVLTPVIPDAATPPTANLGTATITIANPAVVTVSGNYLKNGDQVYFTTTGALPAALSAGTAYYVRDVNTGAGTFSLAATRSGAAISTAGNTQSGTHTAYKVIAPLAVDTQYSGQVIVTAANSAVSNGNINPITRGVPVTPGGNYLFSFFQKSATTATSTLTVSWYDYQGNLISTVANSPVSLTTGWNKINLPTVAPVGNTDGTAAASYAGISLAFSATGTYYIDMFQVAESTIGAVTSASGDGTHVTYTVANSLAPGDTVTVTGVTPSGYNVTGAVLTAVSSSSITVASSFTTAYVSGGLATRSSLPYQEARGVLVDLLPPKTNLLLNPSFQVDTTGWHITSSGATVTGGVTGSPSGVATQSKCAAIVAPTASWSFATNPDQTLINTPIKAGQFYTFSIYAKVSAGTANITTTFFGINSTDPGSPAFQFTQLTTDWQRISETIYISDDNMSNGSGDPQLKVTINGPATTATVYFDAAQLETTYLPTDYFDGDSSGFESEWTFSANDSVSVIYPQKTNRLLRLSDEIINYLPINTPYVVSTQSGVEFSDIT